MIHEVDHTHRLWRVLLMFFVPLLACVLIVLLDEGVKVSLLVALAVVLAVCTAISAGVIAYFHTQDEKAGHAGPIQMPERLRRLRPSR